VGKNKSNQIEFCLHPVKEFCIKQTFRTKELTYYSFCLFSTTLLTIKLRRAKGKWRENNYAPVWQLKPCSLLSATPPTGLLENRFGHYPWPRFPVPNFSGLYSHVFHGEVFPPWCPEMLPRAWVKTALLKYLSVPAAQGTAPTNNPDCAFTVRGGGI